MGFQQGLSGLDAADKNLQVIGNNVANSNTVGFKASTAQFADVYANALGAGGGAQIGIGTSVAAVTEQFAQGNITTTNNPLDLAINGQGFFRVATGNAITYTRDGEFQLDKNGYIVNALGQNLTGYSAANGVVTPGALANMQISSAILPPSATTTTTVGVNLAVNPSPQVTAAFNPADSTTYNFSIPETLYDSLGQSHTAALYFVNASPNNWYVYTNVDGQTANSTTQTSNLQLQQALSNAAAAAAQVEGASTSQISSIQSAVTTAAAAAGATPSSIQAAASGAAITSGLSSANAGIIGTIEYTIATAAQSPGATSASISSAASGAAVSAGMTSAQALTIQGSVAIVPNAGAASPKNLQFTTGGSIVSSTASGSVSVNLNNGAAPLTIAENFAPTTQYGGSFGTNSLTQDGFATGQFSNFSIDKSGIVTGSYSNGKTQILGQVALANFTNVNGLEDLGNNQYSDTLASGAALIGPPGTASLGVLQSSSVEGSNVNLTAELVNLISAQRTYQANAQSIKAEDTVLQTIVSGL